MTDSEALTLLPQRLSPSLPPLDGVAAVLNRCSPSVASLQHVLSLISDFLDFSGTWTIPKACARPGSLPLLRRLLQREKSAASPLDPYYRDWIFNRGVSVAARGGDLDVVKWLMTEYSPRTVVTLGVKVAAAGGHLHVLEWLYECDVEHGTALFEQREMLWAAMRGHLGVLQWLQDKCRVSPALHCVVSPAALLSAKCNFNCLQIAAEGGHLPTVRWLAEQIDASVRCSHADNSPSGLHSLGLTAIVKNGYLQVLEYLGAQAFPWLKLLPSPNTACAAAENGRLDILKWLMSHDLLVVNYQHNYMVAAAARGDLEMLQWMLEIGRINVVAKVVFEAARNGHLNILRCIDENVSNGSVFKVKSMNQAAANGHLEVVKWLHINRNVGCSSRAMDVAAANGHLEVVKWLHFNRIWGCTTFAMNDAASNGHLDVVKWLHANRKEGCNAFAMDRAAAHGFLDVVQWLHANRSEGCSRNTLSDAAKNGHLEVVKWLHENRTERFIENAIPAAASNGHLHVLRWLHANRSEGCTSTAMDLAAANRHLDVVEWLHMHRTEGCTTEAMDEAAARGHLDVVQWLHLHRSEGCTTRAMDEAARHGHFEVMLFLHQNRSEGCSPKAFDCMATGESLDKLRWLAAHYPQHFDPIRMLQTWQMPWMSSNNPAIAAWVRHACDQDDTVEVDS